MVKRTASAAIFALCFCTQAMGVPPKPLMRDFMGINAHTVQFKSDLYSPLCRLVRDYHPYQWDVEDHIGQATHFPTALSINWKDTTGKFHDWAGPVDWQKIYGGWQKDGFEIDACLQIDGVGVKQWPDIDKDTYAYGKAFAAYFGPSHENLVTSAEVGNEPAGNKQYSIENYRIVLRNLARGLRQGDPKLKIVSCAVEAGKTDGYCEPIAVLDGASELYDVINLHKYAFLAGWPSFERTYPESAKGNYIAQIQKSIDWRNQHAASKPVWLTEFGYDASTQPPAANNSQWKGCTDTQQAQWIVRSFLTIADLDVARAYLYFFDDKDQPSLHSSSGVTRNLEPKPSYWAMKHLYDSLGDYRLDREIEKKSDDAWVFQFVNGKDPTKLIWVAWSPTGIDRQADKTLKIPGKIVKAERMPLSQDEKNAVEMKTEGGSDVTVPLTESPLYIWIQK